MRQVYPTRPTPTTSGRGSGPSAAIPTPSIVAPSQRVIVVVAWHDDRNGETGHETYPVLGLVAQPEDGGLAYDFVVYDPCYGLVGADQAWSGVNTAWQACVCPWPPTEDEFRLTGLVAEVRKLAEAKTRQDTARRMVSALAEAKTLALRIDPDDQPSYTADDAVLDHFVDFCISAKSRDWTRLRLASRRLKLLGIELALVGQPKREGDR